MKQNLFYFAILVYFLLGTTAQAQNSEPVSEVIAQEETSIEQSVEPDKVPINVSEEKSETNQGNSYPTITETLSAKPLPEQQVADDELSPTSLPDSTTETVIVENIEPINIVVIPEPTAPFRPSANNKKILIPEYIIYEATRPDFIITHPNPYTNEQPWFLVGVRTQSMKHFDSWGRLIKEYPVSTAKKGVGEVEHSYQTPRGHHKICEKIGDGLAARTIISRRQPTEWFYTEELHKQYPKKDWILTRILWLCGQEEGKNKGYNTQGKVVDSYRRYIYIHGAGDHAPFGVAPSSLGCARMNSEDVINVFSRAPIGTDVVIDETK